MNIRKYSTVILLTLVALILAPLAAPVYADSPIKGHAPAIGMKVQVSPSTELTLLAVKDNQYTWNAKIQPQVTLSNGAPIDPTWHYDGKGTWTAGANLFTATVKGARVAVGYAGETMVWTPRIVSKESFLLLPNDKTIEPEWASPSLLPVDPWNENYGGNTLQWDYGRGIARNVRVIEGLIQEYYTIAAPLESDVVFDAAPAQSKGYTWARELTAWDADGNPVELVSEGEYTVRLPKDTVAAYPITIDPDSTFVTSASDGYLSNHHATYATARTAATAESVSTTATTAWVGVITDYPDANDETFYRAAVYFNTTGLADADNITAASLHLAGSGDTSITNFNVTVISGMATYPHDPLVVADFGRTQYNSTSLGSVSTAGWQFSPVSPVYNTITLTADGVAALNNAGWTKFLIVSSRDLANSGASVDEYVKFYTYEKGATYWPYLNVTYTALASPVATTVAASNAANTTARLNAYINSSGGELCDVRFQYGNVTATYTDATAWVNDTYDTGDNPYADLTGLESDTEYFFRVQVTNSVGTVNGTELSFTTSSSLLPPSVLRAVPTGATMSLSWTKGAGATTTIIRGKAGSYPTSITDGSAVYSGSLNTATHSGLTVGTTYYYTAWGESGGEYSGTTAQTLATTGLAAVVTEVPGTPASPSNWWSETDPSKLDSLPLYDEFCDVIDGYGVARNTGWLFVFISIIILIAAATFGATQGNIMVTGIATGAMFFVFSAVKLLPMWMMGMAIIIFISMTIVRERV